MEKKTLEQIAQLKRRNQSVMIFSGILLYTSLKQWASLSLLEAELTKEVAKKSAEAAAKTAPVVESTAEEIL